MDKQKVPSVIAYDKSGQPAAWGYEIRYSHTPLKWLKLLLVEEDELPPHLSSSAEYKSLKKQVKALRKSPVTIIGDYLRLLWAHAWSQIKVSEGESFVEACKLKIVVTLPAIWSPCAQQRMREALQVAGIAGRADDHHVSLDFVSEPEAAILASLKSMGSREDVEDGDHFVICDAGGGTVDLITYVIESQDPLIVKESVRGSGLVCGSVHLDEGFAKLLKTVVGRDVYKKMQGPGLHEFMNLHWENGLKVQYFGRDTPPYPLTLPYSGSESEGFRSPEIQIQGYDLEPIYTRIFEKVARLVQGQINKVVEEYDETPKFLILVGGFGQSEYLGKCLKDQVRDIPEFIQDAGERPWTAVCRGAVVKGLAECSDSSDLAIIVNSRVARVNWGTVTNISPFENDIHDPRDREWCPVEQEWQAKDQVKWFITIGHPIEADRPIVHPCWQALTGADEDIVTEIVYSYKMLEFKDPRADVTRRDSSVKTLCEIRWKNLLEKYQKLPEMQTTTGQSFRRLEYDVHLTTQGVSLDFIVYHEHEVMGQGNVSLNFDGVGLAVKDEEGA
ncbi:uncharacterized protein F5Z01DRAFT_671400 [Emericellopsis atlantica]|uniref:Uncharacterized protein n=1 Tax=Emericellopsis atlantica TaxID=2614577 RepID=A0A9P8CS82_9HYPO|nr:uncharacterized protein F5Z01DRAFT_671400 [Emericellopsis atlantica]KAG9256950.1 hypothetical protein F5Z01DRAFT_671400 [Emericellopsis atlantica]